jgi:AraC-like DNA-binding protein
MLQSVTRQIAPQCDVTLKEILEDGLATLSFNHNGQRAEPRDIWKARKFIEERSNEHLSLGKVADVAGINPTHLSEKFKQVTGVKFVDYIARIRFERARKLLEDVDLRVSEIAFAVGFQSLSQFNRVFKRFSGKSPREYRVTRSRRRKRH